jgi:hypothetical protein
MPFIISTQTLSRAWEQAQEIARNMRTAALNQKNTTLAGPVAGSFVLNFERELRSYRDRLDAIAALPGIGAYVSGLTDTPAGYTVTTEFNAMRAQVQATIDWTRNNFPRDSTNTFLAERSWAAEGLTERTFTTAQLAGYRTQLDALLATLG